MDMVKSSSVDVVVTTAVLCSVTDMAKVMSQIKRVLVPVSSYLFTYSCILFIYVSNILLLWLGMLIKATCVFQHIPISDDHSVEIRQ